MKHLFLASLIYCSQIGDANALKVVEIDPAIVESVAKDKALPIHRVELVRGNTYGNQQVENIIDREKSTLYSSSHLVLGDSISIELHLDTKKIDELQLFQRTDQNRGSIFSSGTIWVRHQGDHEWKVLQTFKENRGDDIYITKTVLNIDALRVTINNTHGSAIALSEVKCIEFADRSVWNKDLAYFSSSVCDKLSSNFKESDIQKIKTPLLRTLAEDLYTHQYTHEFRSQSYKSQTNPKVVARRLAIGNRSFYDNPTGIFLQGNKKQIVLVSGADQSIPFVIRDFRKGGKEETLFLKNGINVITPEVSGNGYIRYWTTNDRALADIHIHFLYGNEIGYWDQNRQHHNDDWTRVIGKAQKCQEKLGEQNLMFDLLGKRTQVINTIDAFSKYCENPEKITSLLDSVLDIQYQMMGIKKNKVIPSNRTLCLRTWGGPPNWGGSSANFPNMEEGMLTEAGIRKSLWVIGHEIGHGNQIRPNMCMTGWGETTNNSYTQYVQYLLGDKTNLRLDHEIAPRKRGDKQRVVGGRFNAYLNEAAVNKELYLTHEGPDYPKGSKHKEGLRGDHFVKCMPLWQLTLYFMIAGEDHSWYRPDFWADVNWAAIQDNHKSKSNGERYTDFMCRAIYAAKLDLSDFFQHMGLLNVVDRYIDDYRVDKVTITEDQVKRVLQAGSRFSKPSSPVIHYISTNSIDCFKHQREVSGKRNKGIQHKENGKIISHDIWKNVVVFETYSKDKLIDVCMVGTGSKDNSSSVVRYPSSATRIEAVSWNGDRTLVYGKR